jgi:hypothetical protein
LTLTHLNQSIVLLANDPDLGNRLATQRYGLVFEAFHMSVVTHFNGIAS